MEQECQEPFRMNSTKRGSNSLLHQIGETEFGIGHNHLLRYPLRRVEVFRLEVVFLDVDRVDFFAVDFAFGFQVVFFAVDFFVVDFAFGFHVVFLADDFLVEAFNLLGKKTMSHNTLNGCKGMAMEFLLLMFAMFFVFVFVCCGT